MQSYELRVNARMRPGQIRDGSFKDARIRKLCVGTSISPHAVILQDDTFIRLIYMDTFCADRADLEQALRVPLQGALQELMKDEQVDAQAAAAAAPPAASAAGAAAAAPATPSTIAAPSESRKRKNEETANNEEPQSVRPKIAGPALPAAPPSPVGSSASSVAHAPVAAPAAAANPAAPPSARVVQAASAAAARPRAAPRAPRPPRRVALPALSPREDAIIRLEEELQVDESGELSTVASSGGSSSAGSDWLSRYRAAADEVRSVADSDVSTVRLPRAAADGPIRGIIFVTNDSLQQHRPAGFLHRYECGFTTVPDARLRNLFSANLDTRWLLTIPVLDVLAANRAALRTLVAAGAEIIPGRIKWFMVPPVQLVQDAEPEEEAKEGEAEGEEQKEGEGDATVFVNVTTRMILDWIRSAVQPWRDRTQPVAYGPGPVAGPVQEKMLANYNVDRLGRHQPPAAPLLASAPAPAAEPAAAPAVAPAAAPPAGVAPAPPAPGPAPVVAVSSAPVLLRGAALRAAVASVEADVADALPAGAPRRRFRHGVSYGDDAGESDGDDADAVASPGVAAESEEGTADMEIE